MSTSTAATIEAFNEALGRHDWGDGHLRGIDLFKVRDGKVAEKLSYVKG